MSGVQTDSVAVMAKKATDAMATAAVTLREAISASLPVAPTQLMTVQIPGTIIDPTEYIWNPQETAFPPLAVRIAEARLVDGQVPISKIMMGRTGKSVARSYMSTLDCLISTEAALSSAITTTTDNLDPRQKAMKVRYDSAKSYLMEKDPLAEGNTSRLTTYVKKQQDWSAAVKEYNVAQFEQQKLAQAKGLSVEKQKQEFLEWMQANGRDFKAAIQAKYMDWVVHGYKFEIEFYFGVVDVSSAMKRVETSKEAFRNLTLLAADGASEYSGVNLTPRNWATLVKRTIDTWGDRNKGPSPVEIEAEIRRLNNILISTRGLLAAVDGGTFIPNVVPSGSAASEAALQAEYKKSYEKYNDTTNNIKNKPLAGLADTAFNTVALRDNQQAFVKADVERNKGIVQAAVGQQRTDAMKETSNYLNSRISSLTEDIKTLKEKLAVATRTAPLAGNVIKPEIHDAKGDVIDESVARVDPDLVKNPDIKEEPSPWTRITAKVAQSQSDATKSTSESSSSFALKAGWGLFSASAGASTASSSLKAASSMSSLDVSVSMDCMLVEIERPWLHAELFADHELDAAPGFDISPGPEALRMSAELQQAVKTEYTSFSSYPTAFVIAANVELEFNGDTTSLESAMSASTTEANVSVGWGPFAVSASHKQSSSNSKTRSESTATGMRISMQAPQIIAWVQELLPQLPKPKDGNRALKGMELVPITPGSTTTNTGTVATNNSSTAATGGTITGGGATGTGGPAAAGGGGAAAGGRGSGS